MRYASCKFELVESYGILQMLLADNSMEIWPGREFNFDIDFGVTIETNNVNSTVVETVVPFNLTIPYEVYDGGSGSGNQTNTTDYSNEFNFDV
jgi:hypothetical protein